LSSAAELSGSAGTGQVDFDLHGAVGIRVTGGTPADAAAVTRQLGGLRKPLDREPDIVVSFVDPAAAAAQLQYLDLDDAAFDDEAFFVLTTRAGSRLKTRIAFEEIGAGCRIVCESGVGSVPLLIPIVNLVAIANGMLPVHASAFMYEGCGMMVTGWAKGGKTETLLAFMAQGATYIGDEWIYVAEDGRSLFGIPEPIKVWDWHLPELPQYSAVLSTGQRRKLRATTASQRGVERLGGLSLPGSGVLEKVGAKLERQRYVHLAPETLFGEGSCALEGRLDKLIFVGCHESADVTVAPIDPLEVARRMAFSLHYERTRLLETYLEYRFAFPDRPSALVEGVQERERELLLERFAGVEAHIALHPFPPSIPSLFGALRHLAT
jgi:hypothetical protein